MNPRIWHYTKTIERVEEREIPREVRLGLGGFGILGFSKYPEKNLTIDVLLVLCVCKEECRFTRWWTSLQACKCLIYIGSGTTFVSVVQTYSCIILVIKVS